MKFGSKPKMKSLVPFFFDEEESGLCSYLPGNADVSLSEDKESIYVEVAVPGMSPEDININYDKGVLSIKADRKEETENKDRKFYRKSNTHFFYQIAIP